MSARGRQVELAGKISNQNDIQPTIENFQSLVQAPYRLNVQLTVNQAEQRIIDEALKNRIIEFESGSAILAESQQRAAAVKNYLIGKNIPTNSLSVEGLGSNKPVSDNTTAEGRKKNRRIEFEVL